MNRNKGAFDDLGEYVYLPVKIGTCMIEKELKELECFDKEHHKLE